MKVIFNCSTPFMLAHGGQQIQIEQTMAALEKAGVTVEPLRWWDGNQSADILHGFNRVPLSLLRAARRKGWRVVVGALESGLGARPPWARLLLKVVRRVVQTAGPGNISDALGWNSYRLADACIAMTAWEARLLLELFRVEPARLHIIPNGVDRIFLESQPTSRGSWLVCTASLIELKQVLKLAEMAVQAKTPLWIIGKPYSETDGYFLRFVAFARQNPNFIRYEGPISDWQELARVYRQARGFVLLSRWEGLSLSALEAAACECPLLLSDLPWARWFFKANASYCPAFRSVGATAPVLRAFYDQAPKLPLPPKPLSWLQVGQQLQSLYDRLLSPPGQST